MGWLSMLRSLNTIRNGRRYSFPLDGKCARVVSQYRIISMNTIEMNIGDVVTFLEHGYLRVGTITHKNPRHYLIVYTVNGVEKGILRTHRGIHSFINKSEF